MNQSNHQQYVICQFRRLRDSNHYKEFQLVSVFGPYPNIDSARKMRFDCKDEDENGSSLYIYKKDIFPLFSIEE